MASRYISHRYGTSTSQTSTSRSRERSVLNDQIIGGGCMSTQLRDNQAFYSSSTRSSSMPRSRCSRSRSGTPPTRPLGLTVYCQEQPTKSIHERDPLFTDFVTSISSSNTGSLYNSGNMTQLKDQFREQVQDHWDRRSRGDPAVNHDIAYKTHGWSNYLNRGPTTSSEELGKTLSQSDRGKQENLRQSDASTHSVSPKHPPIRSKKIQDSLFVKVAILPVMKYQSKNNF